MENARGFSSVRRPGRDHVRWPSRGQGRPAPDRRSGRGGASKSTLVVRLGALTGLPVVELDALLWCPGPTATPPERWAAVQRELVTADEWIIDGGLGPYDDLPPRLQAADMVIVLDFSFTRCAWRALRRSREPAEFWWWVWFYRRRSLPGILTAIVTHAPEAALYRLRNPRGVRRFLATSPAIRTA